MAFEARSLIFFLLEKPISIFGRIAHFGPGWMLEISYPWTTYLAWSFSYAICGKKFDFLLHERSSSPWFGRITYYLQCDLESGICYFVLDVWSYFSSTKYYNLIIEKIKNISIVRYSWIHTSLSSTRWFNLFQKKWLEGRIWYSILDV